MDAGNGSELKIRKTKIALTKKIVNNNWEIVMGQNNAVLLPGTLEKPWKNRELLAKTEHINIKRVVSG